MYKYTRKQHAKCTNAVNNVQPIRNSSHMAKILSVYNRFQAGDYKNGNGGKRRVSQLTQCMHTTLQFHCPMGWEHNNYILNCSNNKIRQFIGVFI